MGSGQSLQSGLELNSLLEPELRARYQDPATIRKILHRARTVAIVGLSSNPQKASHFVATYLRYAGYRVVPVNPTVDEVLGEPSYPSLADVPVPVDLVDVFRRPEACPDVAREAVAIGAKSLWLQLRVVSLEAAEIAEAGGLDVVMDKCVKIEHGRYGGTLHWVGMNTGIITAKKARR